MLLKLVKSLLIFLFIRETVTVRSEADVYKLTQPLFNKVIDESNNKVARFKEKLNQDMSDGIIVQRNDVVVTNLNTYLTTSSEYYKDKPKRTPDKDFTVSSEEINNNVKKTSQEDVTESTEEINNTEDIWQKDLTESSKEIKNAKKTSKEDLAESREEINNVKKTSNEDVTENIQEIKNAKKTLKEDSTDTGPETDDKKIYIIEGDEIIYNLHGKPDKICNGDCIKSKKMNNSLEQGFDLTSEEMEKFKIWKNGLIPYYIDVVSFSDKVIRETIREFLQTVNELTSVNFVELPSPPTDKGSRWVLFLNRRGLLGCADHSVKDFTTKGVQTVVLGYDCMTRGGELAEAVMSIVGIPAQHNAPDRDNYININTENILPDKRNMFEKLSDRDWLFHDLHYDFLSVTHYDYNKYSTNGHATIVPKDPSVKILPWVAFSTSDIMKIQMLYNYIADKRKIETSECKKLFRPGNKAGKVLSDKSKKLPRKKHCRYVGNCGVEPSFAMDQQQQDLTGSETMETNENGNINGRVKLKNKEPIIDALSLLSDYQTEDDYNTKNNKPQKKKKNNKSANLNLDPAEYGQKKKFNKLKFAKPGYYNKYI